ncbi:uncharacterized protein LOC107710894 [Tachysurus ichikawai]
MDSKGPNFTVAETHALLEGVKCHYASIVESSVAGGMVTNKRKKDIWVKITQNVNAMGSGQKRSLEQVKFRWKNLRARTTKDLAEAKNTQTGNKPFKKGEYTDVVLDIIGEESEPVPHNAEETFILDLSPIIEIQPGSSLVEPAVTGSQKRGLKRPLPNNNDDAYELLLKRETERAEAQILLVEEQIKLTKLQQTKAKLQIHHLKAELGNAGLSSSYEKEP